MTRYERKSLVNFLLVYLGSLFILIAVVATHHYEVRKGAVLKNLEYRMQSAANELARQIVFTHMRGGTLDELLFNLKHPEFKIGLFEFGDQPLYSELSETFKPPTRFYEKEGRYFYLHTGTFDHLDVNYLILESNGIGEELEALQQNILIGVLLVLLFVSITGFFLAKLFLRPIRNEMERIDQFIKDSTHELNTPISSLLMSVKSLLKEQQDNKKLKRIEISARQISDIYKDISYLFLNDVEHREERPLQLDSLIRERVEYFSPLMEGKRIALEQALCEKEITIDLKRATLLIDNLLSNAIKYSSPGGQIKITLDEQQLSIKDSGQGIPDVQKKLIFERYKRFDNVAGGFGIGLHIVKSICDEYGFGIDVRDSESGGSVFVVGWKKS